MTFTHILCPIDFSDTSKRALEYAVAFAGWHHARLALMHVAPSFEPVVAPSARLGGPTELVYPVRREEVLDALRGEAAAAGVPHLETVAEEGDVAKAILNRALTWPADLVVVGTHGRGGAERALVGSVAERLMHKAPCPVLTVPPSAHRPSTRTPARLLCPIDFSPASLQALGCALQLAEQLHAQLTVLHVVEWPFEDERPLPPQSPIAHYRRQLLDDAAARLEGLAPQASLGGLSHVLVAGHVKTEIPRYAEQLGADLIVMGAQSRSGIGLALLGSTTERIVRHATCPVLTLRGTVLTPADALVDR